MVCPLLRGRSPTQIGRAKTAEGARACFLSGISALGAWVPKNLARRKFWFIGFGGAMLLEAIGPPGRCAAIVDLLVLGPRVNLSLSPLRAREGQAVVCPLLRGRSPTQIGRAKTAEGARACFSPAFRARRVGAEESGAA